MSGAGSRTRSGRGRRSSASAPAITPTITADAPEPRRAAGSADWIAGALIALLLFAVAVAYDGRASTPYFTPRVMALYPVTLFLFILWLWVARSEGRSLRTDLLDWVAGGFLAWQIVAALLSPARLLAFVGEQNRGTGVLFWAAAVALFVLSRRLLGDRAVPLRVLTGAIAAALVVAAAAALAQSFDVAVPWGEVDLGTGRMTGSAGNAVSLGGLGLLGVWAGVVAAGSSEWGLPTRIAGAAGAFAGMICIVLSVTRAAYLGLAMAVVVLAAFWLRHRQSRRTALVAGGCVVLALASYAYGARGGDESSVVGRVATAEGSGEVLAQTDEYRLEFWRAAGRAVADHPVVGVGPGAFTAASGRYLSAAFFSDIPDAFVTDPHDVVLLMGATSGIPGAVLGVSLLVLGLAAAARRRVRPSEGEGGLSADGALAGLAYGVAAAAFLLVSPADFLVVVPLAMLLGAAAGPPRLGLWRAREVSTSRVGRPVAWGLGVAAGVMILAFVVAGVQFYRADISLARAFRGLDPALAEEADRLYPYSPRFSMMAGSMLWREAAVAGDLPATEPAEALLHDAVRLDPTRLAAWTELSRLYLALGQIDEAVDAVEEGLRLSPHHPLLEGLLGSAAVTAVQQGGDEEVARALIQKLEMRPPETPDGWFWLGAAYAALGDKARADEAHDRAQALDGGLTTEDYLGRIRGIG